MKDMKEYSKYIFIGILALIAYLIFLVIKPFLVSIVTAMILTYIFYPAYKFSMRKTNQNQLISSLLCILLTLLLIIIPISLSIGTVSQSVGGYMTSLADIVGDDAQRDSITAKVNDLTGINIQSKEFITTISQKVYSFGNEFVSSIPQKLISLFVILFLMFYLFQTGPALVQRIYFLIPLKYSIKNIILKDFKDVTYAVIYGNIITAIAQGCVAFIGYLIFGVEGALFWGLLTGMFSLFPYVGTTIVWFPSAVVLLLKGHLSQGVGLLIYGALIIGTVDNFLKPKIIGQRANIHPALVLLGVVGGIQVFGFIGLFLGPLLFASFNTLIKIYNKYTELSDKEIGKSNKDNLFKEKKTKSKK